MTELVLKTNGLTKKYGGKCALDHASITVGKGQIYGLVGRNGAGKTTLMRLVTGQSLPSGGDIQLLGESGSDLNKARSRTGAMIETPSFAPFLSARENLEYYRIQRGIPGKAAVDEVLEQVDLTKAGKKKFKAFSLGMKQRLGLALALMNHPDFLILDEPINGLDPEGVVEFRSILRKLNRERSTTILISSHILTELSTVATCYGFLDNGVVLEEITADALAEKCRACLELRVDDPAKAVLALEETLHTRDYEVLPGGVLQVFTHLDAPQLVSAALAERGVALFGLEVKGADLESYFLNLIEVAVMLNYLRAECYKLVHRKYTWIALAVILILEALLVSGWAFINSNGSDVDFYTGASMLVILLELGFWSTIITGDIVFADQYKHNTLKNEVSFGIPRSRIYLGKLVAQTLLAIFACVIIVAFYLGLCAMALYHDPVQDRLAMQMIGYCLLVALPLWVGVQALTCAAYFTVRNSTVASMVVVFVLVALSTVIQLAALFFDGTLVGQVMMVLYENMPPLFLKQAPQMVGDWALCGRAWLVGGIWTVLATAVGLWGFSRKEIA